MNFFSSEKGRRFLKIYFPVLIVWAILDGSILILALMYAGFRYHQVLEAILYLGGSFLKVTVLSLVIWGVVEYLAYRRDKFK